MSILDLSNKSLKIDAKYNNTLSKVFSSALFKELSNSNFEQFKKLQIIYKNSVSSKEKLKVKDFLEIVYNYLKKNYASEYIYKNEILRQVVLKNHKLSETSIFTEFPCALSKADLLIVNGTTTIYEIKTELDNLNRLEEQISNYSKTFAKVNIITYHNNLKRIGEIVKNNNIGILVYSTKNNKFETIRDASEDLTFLESKNLFNVLRTEEYKEVILKEFGFIPPVSNTLIYDRCFSLFKTLPIETQHEWIVNLLGLRKINKHQIDFSKKLPISLKTLGITKLYTEIQCKRIENSLNIQL